MWWPARGSRKVLEGRKMVKFVELLVHEYLQAKGYEETSAKFAKESARTARDAGVDSPDKGTPDGGRADDVDEADSWYFFADRLDLPELLRQNDAAVTGRRFNAILEVLVKEMVRRCDARSRAPPSVSIVSLRDGVGKRKLVADSLSLPLELPRSITTGITKEAASLDGKESDISELTKPEEVQEVSQHGGGSYRSHAASIGREKKEHPKASPWQAITGGARGNFGSKQFFREATRAKKLGGHLLSHNKHENKGGKRAKEESIVLNRFHFSSSDAVRRRQQRSHENWIPEELRIKMMRRSMRVIKENVFQSIAQGSLVSRARKRSNRSELQIVKTQEKFGTKHQRPCALCMYSFSEINLVQAVPFKAIVDLRAAWRKTFPQASESTSKTRRTMLSPTQCYNEVKVCAFCSQLFHDPLGYRPTWDMQLTRMREKRDKVTREREREYWDPLRNKTDQNQCKRPPKEVEHSSSSYLEVAKS